MRRWLRIAKYPHIDPRCSPAQARRNYWRLCKSHPEVMTKLGLSEIAVYQ
jgi:hypothetical protein